MDNVARLSAAERAILFQETAQRRGLAPLIIEKGKGSYLIDTEGRKYLDGTSSIWVNLHGHRHPRLDRALTGQLKQIAHSTFLGLSNPPAIRLARELIRLAPKGLRRVFYSDNGSTAVEVALKMAVQYWQQRAPKAGPKQSFLHLKMAYHGDTVGAVSVGNIELFHARFKPLLFPTHQVDPPYCYRCPLNLTYPDCRMACLDPLEALLKTRHRELAGVILEPLVQAAAGMMVAPPGEPVPIRKSPIEPSSAILNTSVGAIELRGRLLAWMRLAIGPLESLASTEKSVSWLFSRKPRVKWNEPMPLSIVVVMTTTLPSLSTIDMCVVPLPSCTLLPAGVLVANTPACAVPMLRVVEISAARERR